MTRVRRYLLLGSGALYLVMWVGGVVAYIFRGAYYGIPASNFLGWFLVSAVIFIVLRVAPGRWADNVWTRRIGLSIVVFFTVIAAAYELWLAVAVGALLVCLDVATSHVLRTET